MMRSTTVNLTMTGVFVLMLLPAAALAQSEDRRGWIYAFAGTGAEDAAWSGTRRQLGGGGERMIHDAVGVGGEVGYYSPAGTFRNGISIVSASLTGHINRTGRTSPFVSGGFSLATDLFSTTPGGHLAGGLNHWVGRRVAVRGEYRAHVLSNRRIHSVRAGLSLR